MKEEDSEFLYREINKLINSLKIFNSQFSSSIEILIKILNDYKNFKPKKENQIINFLLMRENGYNNYIKKEKILNKFKNKIQDIYWYFIKYIEEYEKIKVKIIELNLKKINKKSIEEYFEKIEKYNWQILSNLLIFKDTSYNDLILRKNKIKQTSKEIIYLISTIENLLFENFFYHYKLNFNKLKKISVNEIQEGDIIILRKDFSVITGYRKFLAKILKSNFIHSASVYKKINNKIYLFEANAYNKRKTNIAPLEIKKGLTYIVLRPKQKLSKKQIEKLQKLEEKKLEIKFSRLKTFVGIYERFKEKYLSEYTFLPIKRLNNSVNFLSGTFCSEIISEIYSEIGIKLGHHTDHSMISPVDILNSSELKIIGYFKRI